MNQPDERLIVVKGGLAIENEGELASVPDIRADVRPAVFTGASMAVLGTVGGAAPALLHSVLVSGEPLSFALMLGSDLVVVGAIGAGQGLLAVATALARGRGRWYISPRRGLLAALAVGTFNGLMYLTQMFWPVTELGWTLDLAILGLAGAAVGWLAVRVPDTTSRPALPPGELE